MKFSKYEWDLIGKLNNFGLHGNKTDGVYTEEDTAVLYDLIEKLKREFYEDG